MSHVRHADFEETEGRSLELDFDLTDDEATQPEHRARATAMLPPTGWVTVGP